MCYTIWTTILGLMLQNYDRVQRSLGLYTDSAPEYTLDVKSDFLFEGWQNTDEGPSSPVTWSTLGDGWCQRYLEGRYEEWLESEYLDDDGWANSWYLTELTTSCDWDLGVWQMCWQNGRGLVEDELTDGHRLIKYLLHVRFYGAYRQIGRLFRATNACAFVRGTLYCVVDYQVASKINPGYGRREEAYIKNLLLHISA